jgi:hypothetical protein
MRNGGGGIKNSPVKLIGQNIIPPSPFFPFFLSLGLLKNKGDGGINISSPVQ